jgi:hypothetical protein
MAKQVREWLAIVPLLPAAGGIEHEIMLCLATGPGPGIRPVRLCGRTLPRGDYSREFIMTVLADFVVTNNQPADASTGKWKSVQFESGGRLTRTVSGVEQHNAYITLTLTSPTGGQDVAVRVIVNDHPLPELVEVKEDSQRTAAVAFPASFLRDGSGNVIELHSQGERPFIVLHVICHFRQNS